MSRIHQNLAKSTTKICNFFQKCSKMTQIYFWDRFWTALEKLLWESMISFLNKSFYDPLLGDINVLFFFQKKSLLSGGPRPPVNPAAYSENSLCYSETTWFSCFSRFWRCCGVFQGWAWLTKVVPSILRVQWVYIRALAGDILPLGRFWGLWRG